MKSIIDIYESVLTKTKDNVKTAKETIGKMMEIQKFAKKVNDNFCDITGKLWKLKRDKLINFFSKRQKPRSLSTDHFGQTIQPGDVVLYDFTNMSDWYGIVIQPSTRNRKYEWEIMESGAIYPDREDPFEETALVCRYGNEFIKICHMDEFDKVYKTLLKETKK
jgi:hypothetical protein